MDMLNAYAVYDVKLEQYSAPFYAASDIEAVRRFREMMLNVPRALYFSNFQLDFLGKFDTTNGSFTFSETDCTICSNNELFYSELDALAKSAGIEKTYKD